MNNYYRTEESSWQEVAGKRGKRDAERLLGLYSIDLLISIGNVDLGKQLIIMIFNGTSY